MSGTWLVAAVVPGALFGAAALLVEPVCGSRRRWVWLAALVSTAAVPVLALLAPALWPSWLSWRTTELALPLAVPVTESAGPVVTGTKGVQGALVLWVVATLLCLSRWVHGWLRVRALVRACEPTRLGGWPVLLSEGAGPAVAGLIRPRIVAPRWLAGMAARRCRMVVLHEAEHVRAGDHWVLALAPLVAAIFPWNLALWWQLRRLRQAVELDCDARVMRRGVGALEYGRLLLDVAGSAGVRVAPALSAGGSLLHRRLAALVARRRQPATLRQIVQVASAAGLAGAGAVVTSPERVIATTSPSTIVFSAAAPPVEHTVGPTVQHPVEPPAAARSLPRPTEPAPIMVARADVAVARAAPLSIEAPRLTVRAVAGRVEVPSTEPPQPLFIVDGVIVGAREFATLGLDPDGIESIEVVKGPAAEALYGRRGAGGVISISTRRPARL